MGKKREKNTSHFPSFQTATNLLSSSNNPINNSNNIDNIQDATQIKLLTIVRRQKSKILKNLLKVGPQSLKNFVLVLVIQFL